MLDSFFMILLGGILLIWIVKKIKANLNRKDFYKLGLTAKILLYASPIFWIIFADWPYTEIGEDLWFEGKLFWDLFRPSFGIIGPFISASLGIIGLLIPKYFNKLNTNGTSLDKEKENSNIHEI